MNNPAATINVPHLAPVEAAVKLKFHQVAIYTRRPEFAMTIWGGLGFHKWSRDTAVLVGEENGVPVTKRATMVFNYDIMPLELEYVSYHGPRNAHDSRDGNPPFISHLSTMVDDVDEEVEKLSDLFGIPPYHRFVTEQHTNPHCTGKKRFREAIFDTAPFFGFDIKLIQRIPWDWAE